MVPKLVDISKRQASHKIYYKDIALTPGEESERAGLVDVAMIQGRTRVIRLRPVSLAPICVEILQKVIKYYLKNYNIKCRFFYQKQYKYILKLIVCGKIKLTTNNLT